MTHRALPAVFLLLLAAVVSWLLLPTDSGGADSRENPPSGEGQPAEVHTGDETTPEAASQPSPERQELEEN